MINSYMNQASIPNIVSPLIRNLSKYKIIENLGSISFPFWVRICLIFVKVQIYEKFEQNFVSFLI